MKSVFIVAGGTGGHINAALSMGDELSSEYEVTYISGMRYLDYQLFENKNVVHINSRPLRSPSKLVIIKNLFLNIMVFFQIISLVIKKNPAFVLGAGGYVCGPTLLCAKILGKKIFIIEQNAVAGLTNRLLAGISALVFTNFKDTKGLEKVSDKKIRLVGNPIRKSIKYHKNKIQGPLKILIFGGSLGATQINEAVQILLDNKFLNEVEIYHQTGKDNFLDFDESESTISYEQNEFIDNMNAAYAWANIIIARAGASTVSELRVVRKPTILIPFPGATDNHQYLNALKLKEENLFPCEIIDHKLKGEELANELVRTIKNISLNEEIIQFPNNSESTALKIKQEIKLCLN